MTAGFHQLVDGEGCVLVVGGHTHYSHFPHEHLLYWSSDRRTIVNRLSHTHGKLPANVRGVVLTRLVGNSERRRLINVARNNDATVIVTETDAELVHTLTALTARLIKTKRSDPVTTETTNTETTHAEETPETVETVETATIEPETVAETSTALPIIAVSEQEDDVAQLHKHKPVRGELTNFIRENADFTLPDGITEEAKRLFPLAHKAGLDTTLGSVTQAIRVQRNDNEKAAAKAAAPAHHKTTHKTPQRRAASRVKETRKKDDKDKVDHTTNGAADLLALVDAADNSLKLLRAGVQELARQQKDFAKAREVLKGILG